MTAGAGVKVLAIVLAIAVWMADGVVSAANGGDAPRANATPASATPILRLPAGSGANAIAVVSAANCEGDCEAGVSFLGPGGSIAFYDFANDSLLFVDPHSPSAPVGLRIPGIGMRPVDGVVAPDHSIYLLVDELANGISRDNGPRFWVYRWTDREARWGLFGRYDFAWLGRRGTLDVFDRAIHLTLDRLSQRPILQNKDRGVAFADSSAAGAGRPDAAGAEIDDIAWRTGWGEAAERMAGRGGLIPDPGPPPRPFFLMGMDRSGHGYSVEGGPDWSGTLVVRDVTGAVLQRTAIPRLAPSLGFAGKGPLLVTEDGEALWLHIDQHGLTIYELRKSAFASP